MSEIFEEKNKKYKSIFLRWLLRHFEIEDQILNVSSGLGPGLGEDFSCSNQSDNRQFKTQARKKYLD